MRPVIVLLSSLVIATGCGRQEPAATAESDPAAVEDPYMWLEDVEGEQALAWVEE